MGLGHRSEAVSRVLISAVSDIFTISLTFTISLSKIVIRYFNDFTDIYDFTEQNRDPPTHKIFSIPEIFWKTGGLPYQVFRFGPVRQNFFRQYRDNLCMKIFDNGIFLKHKRVPLRSFSAETKNFQRKIVINISLLHKI